MNDTLTVVVIIVALAALAVIVALAWRYARVRVQTAAHDSQELPKLPTPEELTPPPLQVAASRAVETLAVHIPGVGEAINTSGPKPPHEPPGPAEWGQRRALLARMGVKQADVSALIGTHAAQFTRAEAAANIRAYAHALDKAHGGRS